MTSLETVTKRLDKLNGHQKDKPEIVFIEDPEMPKGAIRLCRDGLKIKLYTRDWGII